METSSTEQAVNQQGIKRLQEILGADAMKIVESLSQISPSFAKYIINFGYAELYTREGLSDKERELAAVSSLISQGQTGLPLQAHVQGMLNVGWQKEEILELVIFLIGYAGFPKTVDALKTVHSVFSTTNA